MLPALGRFVAAVAAGAIANIISDTVKAAPASSYTEAAHSQLQRHLADGYGDQSLPSVYRSNSHVLYPVGNLQKTDFRVPVMRGCVEYQAQNYDEYGDPRPSLPTYDDLGYFRSVDVAALCIAARDLTQRGFSPVQIHDLLMPATPIWFDNGAAVYSSLLANVTLSNELCNCLSSSVFVYAKDRYSETGFRYRGHWPLFSP